MHWVISDIHGCFDDFMNLKNKIETRDNDAKIVIAGDILDRGPKTAELLEWCMEYANKPDGKYILLMGNHEDLVLEWFGSSYKKWNENGRLLGKPMPQTNFDFDAVILNNNWLNEEILRPKIDFIRNLPLYYIVETKKKKFLIVHAWAPRKDRMAEIIAGRMVTSSEISVFLWDRRDEKYYDNEEFYLVHGHTPTLLSSSGKKAKIDIGTNVINVDCGCNWRKKGGRLAAICLENENVMYY